MLAPGEMSNGCNLLATVLNYCGEFRVRRIKLVETSFFKGSKFCCGCKRQLTLAIFRSQIGSKDRHFEKTGLNYFKLCRFMTNEGEGFKSTYDSVYQIECREIFQNLIKILQILQIFIFFTFGIMRRFDLTKQTKKV